MYSSKKYFDIHCGDCLKREIRSLYESPILLNTGQSACEVLHEIVHIVLESLRTTRSDPEEEVTMVRELKATSYKEQRKDEECWVSR